MDDGERIQAYLRTPAAGREAVQVGPFVATFTPGSNHPARNYAIPDDDAPSRAQIDALVHAFVQRGLVARLEYVDAEAPLVLEALLEAGFALDERIALMACPANAARQIPAPPGVRLVLATTTAEHVAALTVANEAFGAEITAPSAAEIAMSVARVAAGGAVALAIDEVSGEPLGSAQLVVPRDGVAELVGVATRASARRRGIAAATTSLATWHGIKTGVDLLWLTPASADSERVYGRAGFERIGGELVQLTWRSTA